MKPRSLINALLAALAVSVAGLAGCSTSVNAPPQPTPTPTPASDPTPQADASVEYRNSQYGFSLSLPASWQGHTVVVDKWAGSIINASPGQAPAEEGPQILIRHPKWTSQNPRQDIPIMVFTLEQWNALEQGSYHIGAAPMNPSELGRNALYVFALPARYNYAFPEGFEEVEQILQGRPLRTFEPAG